LSFLKIWSTVKRVTATTCLRNLGFILFVQVILIGVALVASGSCFGLHTQLQALFG
jgi:hypothetical protein